MKTCTKTKEDYHNILNELLELPPMADIDELDVLLIGGEQWKSDRAHYDITVMWALIFSSWLAAASDNHVYREIASATDKDDDDDSKTIQVLF